MAYLKEGDQVLPLSIVVSPADNGAGTYTRLVCDGSPECDRAWLLEPGMFGANGTKIHTALEHLQDHAADQPFFLAGQAVARRAVAAMRKDEENRAAAQKWLDEYGICGECGTMDGHQGDCPTLTTPKAPGRTVARQLAEMDLDERAASQDGPADA